MKSWKRILLGVLLFYSAVHLVYSMRQYNIFTGSSGGDFNRAYLEAMEWKRSGPLSPDASVLHPPFYYLTLIGMDAMLGGIQPMSRFFYFLQFILYPLAVLWMVRTVYGSSKPGWVPYALAVVLTLNFQPFLETLAQYKVEGIEFTLICLSIFLFQKYRDTWCGVVLLIASNLKYLPAILLVHFLIKRQWRVLRGAIVAAVILLGILWATCGTQALVAVMVKHPLDLLLNPHKHAENSILTSVEMQTLTKTIYRWFAQADPPSALMKTLAAGGYVWVAPWAVPLAFWLAVGLKVLLSLLYLVFLKRGSAGQQREEAAPFHLLEISLSLVMIFMLIQASRVHYGILALPGFVFVALLLHRYWSRFAVLEKVLFAVAYSFSAMAIPGGLLNRLPPNPVWGQSYSLMYLWWSIPFYGYALLGICIPLCHRRLKRGVV